MKISEILRTLADLTATIENSQKESEASVVTQGQLHQDHEVDQVNDILKLSGVARASTTPDEHYFPLSSAFPAGDDFHHSKNPADMRSDSVSLYPSFSARPKE
jgi:hypothetical protein